MRRLPASTAVVAFAGTAKLTAASTNPDAAIRGVFVHLMRQFSQSEISRGKAIVFKIGIRDDACNRCRELRAQVAIQTRLSRTSHDFVKYTFGGRLVAKTNALSGQDPTLT
jgi:hypothetical protein